MPVDGKRNLLWNFNLFRRRGRFGVMRDWMDWLFFKSWAHDWLFSEQDKWIVEQITPGDECLSRTDVGVAAWRRFVQSHARKPPRSAEEAAAPDRFALRRDLGRMEA